MLLMHSSKKLVHYLTDGLPKASFSIREVHIGGDPTSSAGGSKTFASFLVVDCYHC